MKLVELLARELNEWPENVSVYFQWGNGKVFATSKGIPTEYSGSMWYVAGSDIEMAYDAPMYDKRLDLAEDHDTANVNKAQWQAERDRQKGGEWKRHRGGKCPVSAGSKVSTRHRDGKVVDVHFHTATTNSGAATMNAIWKHTGDAHDIMSYKVISQPSSKAEARAPFGGDPIVEYAFGEPGCDMSKLDWKPLGNAKTGDIEFYSVKAGEAEVNKFCMGKNCNATSKNILHSSECEAEHEASYTGAWAQSSGPLAWRDTIIHCQAIIEDCEREIERNVELLDAEGLMMQVDSKKAMQAYDVLHVEPKEWQIGDILEVVARKGASSHEFEIGEHVMIDGFDLDDDNLPVRCYALDKSDFWYLKYEEAKFISRP